MKIKCCIHNENFIIKPANKVIGRLCREIASCQGECNIEELAFAIGQGCSWCPCQFTGDEKTQENFKEQQLFVLDFDGGITISDALARAGQYKLNPIFYYETLSGIDYDRFRMVFCLSEPIHDKRIAKVIQNALVYIFSECDSGSKDFTRMYLGGRKVVLNDGNFIINLYDLLIALESWMDQNPKNFTRSLSTFCRQLGLMMKQYRIQIDISDSSINQKYRIEDFDTFTYIYYQANELKSSFSYNIYLEKKTSTKTMAHIKPKIKKRRKEMDIDSLENKCRLYNEFVMGEKWLYHNDLFGLMTNLANIRCGDEIFRNVVNNYPEWYSKCLLKEMDHVQRSDYNPQSCDKFCQYSTECIHNNNIIETVKLPVNDFVRIPDYNENYYPIESVREDLKLKLHEIISSKREGVYFLKAQTGIGKTYAYLEYISHSQEQFLIAVPTNRLKDEIYKKAIYEFELNIIKTASIEDIKGQLPDLYYEVKSLYEMGAEEEARAVLKESIENEPNFTISEYLKKSDRIRNATGHVITTHASLINMNADVLGKFQIIIDEDITKTLFQTRFINKKTVEEILQIPMAHPIIYDKLQSILYRMKAGSKAFKIHKYNLSWEERRSLFEFNSIFIENEINIIELLEAENFCYDSRKDGFYYSVRKQLNKQIKYLILSATLDKELCEVFYKPQSVFFYECKKAEYKGRVILYHDVSYSRNYINKNPQSVESIQEKHKGLECITYKGYNPNARGGDIYMGASEGLDSLNGQDLLIIGTPNTPPEVYKLMAMECGIEDVSGNWILMEVEYQGFRFSIPTFKNEMLRLIQFWTLSSILEQSVGRARLISEFATVHLYSKFPVAQATLNEEIDNY